MFAFGGANNISSLQGKMSQKKMDVQLQVDERTGAVVRAHMSTGSQANSKTPDLFQWYVS